MATLPSRWQKARKGRLWTRARCEATAIAIANPPRAKRTAVALSAIRPASGGASGGFATARDMASGPEKDGILAHGGAEQVEAMIPG